MFTPEQFRAKAAEYAKRAKGSDGMKQVREYEALERRFTALADNEQWLTDNYDKTVHTRPREEPSELAVADDEERMLRYLGAAVSMHWRNVPTKLQRERFLSATTMGELSETEERRGQIARFLHKQNGFQ